MDVQAVKNELPDDPAELLKLHEDLGGFGSNYCIARIDDGKVTAMALMALIKVTTNITPIQHELIRARQELSRMGPKHSMLMPQLFQPLLRSWRNCVQVCQHLQRQIWGIQLMGF